MKISVAVFFGGRSVEHEISVISALQAMRAIDPSLYDVVPVYITKQGEWYSGKALWEVENYKDTDKLLTMAEKVFFSPVTNDQILYKAKKGWFGSTEYARIDVALPVLHGSNGEDGSLQGLFQLKGIAYGGCNVLSSAIGMDKVMMKKVLRESGIPVVDYVFFTDKKWHSKRDDIRKQVAQLGYPVIVKPSNLGSSVGISKAADQAALDDAVDLAGSFSSRILVEKMVVNLQEINCSVLGDAEEAQPSVCEEPLRSGDILSYKDKYMSKSGGSSKGMSSTQRKIPADLSPDLTRDIQQTAVHTFQMLDAAGVSRIDFLVDKDTGKFYVNEINTIPGSLSFYLWEATGKSFTTLMSDLINLALKRQREQANLMVSYDQNIFSMGGADGLKLGGAKKA